MAEIAGALAGEAIMNIKQMMLSRDEVRSLDAVAIRELGIPGLVLMENAARGVCDEVLRGTPPKAIHVLCGAGNNGGDGFALARQLAANGREPVVWLLSAGKPLTHDCDCNRKMWLSSGGNIREDTPPHQMFRELQSLNADDLIVDCLLGTGVQGAPREPFAGAIVAVNNSPAEVLAVDLPSGLDCDTGLATGECVQAARTVTFVAMKAGFNEPLSAKYTGHVSVAHIGIPRAWVREWTDNYRASSDGSP